MGTRETPPDSPVIAARPANTRSRITNGSSLFIVDVNGEPIDGRTTLARRFRDVLDAILSDLGGRDAISEGKYQLAAVCESPARPQPPIICWSRLIWNGPDGRS